VAKVKVSFKGFWGRESDPPDSESTENQVNISGENQSHQPD